MNSDFVPPLVAGVAAIALTIQRYLTTLLLELSVDLSASSLTRYTLGAQFTTFLLVYGLLFSVSYWAGTTGERAWSDAALAVVAFSVAAVSALVTTAAVALFVDAELGGLVFAASVVTGTSVATGVKVAVVVFAGVALPHQLQARVENPEPNSQR